MKSCVTCGEIKPARSFYKRKSNPDGLQNDCIACAAVKFAKFQKERMKRDPRYNTKRQLRYVYKITLREREALLSSQGGRCAVCEEPIQFSGSRVPEKLAAVIDHDHVSGAIRGILCSLCNKGLGKFRDDPTFLRLAATYLENNNSTLHS